MAEVVDVIPPPVLYARLDPTSIDNWLDGRVWALQAGTDYPDHLTEADLYRRLDVAARRRKCRVRVWSMGGVVHVCRRHI
jgi:hypothetical protein